MHIVVGIPNNLYLQTAHLIFLWRK